MEPLAADTAPLASKSFTIVIRYGAPGSNIFPMALRHGAAILFAMALPASSSAAALRLAAVPRRPGQQKLRHGALASNKPHPAEKSTPVWLPIWCTWAGFANSQLRCATFHSTYSYKCTSSLLPTWSRCSDIANLSAHLRRLPTPPPYLRRMRLSPGRGAGIRWEIRPSLAWCGVPANHRAHESLF